MDSISVKRVPLKRLQTMVEGGIFAIPELQREFVWNARKACDLLDSIYRNYPIGTILVWKTDRRNEGQLRKKYHTVSFIQAPGRGASSGGTARLFSSVE